MILRTGTNEGGFTTFSFDITPYIKGNKKQKLVVRVWDPTDRRYQTRGKQINNPHGLWYTPVTGIWQTVWMEPVNSSYITNIKAIPNIDNETLNVTVNASNAKPSDIVTVTILDQGNIIGTAKGIPGKDLRIPIKNPKLWSPESPYLYDMKVSLNNGNKTLDQIDSYTAMRKISTKRDSDGIVRMQLNNQDYFQFGPLDQGWWPDGLYTAPTDEALLFDIKKTKDYGFNMIRKHVKVEPARWYYHCDKEGILEIGRASCRERVYVLV